MKITRYLWIHNLSSNCEENDIRQTFQSHGKIQTIRIHKNNNSRGAIVAFIDCKSSTKAYESVKALMDMPLKLEYCEANGEPGINCLGNNGSNLDSEKNIEKSNEKQSVKTNISSRSRSNSSNTSSFGSSIDDCSKYPGIQQTKRVDENSNNYDFNDNERNKKSGSKTDSGENDKQCLNKDLCGLLIENLSQRSSDTSLREGLFHEYKKHGKITSVTVMGQASSRYAIISFKRSEDMEKAFEASQGKIFFGNQIKAKQHNGFNYIDPDLCPPEHAMDEYHPKATKTLFVGKLTTGCVTETDLKKSFKKYGEIIDIDIKTQSNQPDTSFAFVQYYDISSVVRALRNQDNIKIDNKSVKLGFGKSQPTNCLWIGNLQRNATEAFLRRHFRRYGPIVLVIPDPEYSCALIQFDCVEDAQRALTDTRDRSNGNNNNNNKRMQVDYASNEYQIAFMNRLRKSCQFDSHDLLKNYADPYQTEKIQNLLISYTKYLGLLEETRPQSFDRYDNKSDYEEYDDVYSGRQSRHRKFGHQRVYNDNYGLDEEYSDDYRYTKSSGRHYDDYSPTHSLARYSRSSQKFSSSDQYNNNNNNNSRNKFSNYRYNNDYYDAKHETVSSSNNNYYGHRRPSPDSAFVHSNNHNRSFSPSPSPSSVEYCGDQSRYNLTTSKRYRYSSNKDYRSSRSKVDDTHEGRTQRYERTPESRAWNKNIRYDYDGGGGGGGGGICGNSTSQYRSKSGSRSRLSGSNSPSSRHSTSQQRSYRNDSVKKSSRVRKATHSNQSRLNTIYKTNQKLNSSTTNNAKLSTITGTIFGNKVTGVNDTLGAIGVDLTGNKSVSSIIGSSISNAISSNNQSTTTTVSQSADTLSKLERERAKLLQELSMLSEDASTIGSSNSSSKIAKLSGKILPSSEQKIRNVTHKSQRQKHASPLASLSGSDSAAPDAKRLNSSICHELPRSPESSISNNDIIESKTIKIPYELEIIKSEDNPDKNHLNPLIQNEAPITLESREFLSSSISKDIISTASCCALDLCAVDTSLSSFCVISANTETSNDCIASSIQCRDPRLVSPNHNNIRPVTSVSICTLLSSPIEIPTTISVTTSSINACIDSSNVITTSSHLSVSTSYKDSTSDSDLEHLSNVETELDKRIRELDAKMIRSEQTVRTLDYSKFRIRKKICDNVGNCSTTSTSCTSGLISSPTCLSTPLSLSSLSVSSSLLDVVGYSTLSRDNTSNTSEFIKTMLNQTKFKSYHLLGDSNDHLSSNYSAVVSTNSSSLPFRTVDLGANDIERRTLFSRYGSMSSSTIPLLDTKLSVDTGHLSPTINTYNARFVSTTNCSVSSSKMPSTLTVSPTTTTSSTTSTPTILYDLNQPMKSILKKSIPASTPTSANISSKSSEISAIGKYKSSLSQDCSATLSETFPVSNHNNNKSLSKKSSSNSLKRKSQSESEDSIEYSKTSKKIKTESGPVLDNSLFQTYPSAPIKKIKRSSKNLFSSSNLSYSKYEDKNQYVSKKSSSLSTNIAHYNSNSRNTDMEKISVSKKSAKISQSNHQNQKSSKLYKDKKKSGSKLSISTKKSKSKVNMKQINSNRKAKPVKNIDKVTKSTKRSKDRGFYDSIISDNDVKEDIEDDNNEGMSEFDEDFEKDSGSSENGNYESMYDKIKRRNSKKSASSGKKRRNKHLTCVANTLSSDAMDSEDSEYWINKSSKKCVPIKRKRARLSDLSSSHFSDSNSCKTTPCGKSLEPQLSSDYSGLKSEIINQNNFFNMKTNDECIKEESITDESKAPAESFNLSSPHNSSQCSSPKYSKDISLVSINRDFIETSCISTVTQPVQAYQTRSQHRPNDGPLKKRPIAEPIVLSEDLPYLEKQPDEEFISTSPTSINEEPPSQLESIYDMPQSQQTNVLEEVVLDDHQHSLDVVEVEFGLQDTTNDPNQIDIDPPLPADVDSASHILMTMKTQPNIEIEYASVSSTNEPDQQIQSVAEHLISLAQNSIVSSVGLPPSESAVMITEEDKQSQMASTRACKVNNSTSKQKDYEVTIYVKNIIDKIKKETDLANSLNKDKLVCKRNKKSNTFSMTMAKQMPNPTNQEGRQIIPLETDLSTRSPVTTTTVAITNTQPVVLPGVSQTCVFITNNQFQDQSSTQMQKCQLIKPSETKRLSQVEESASISSIGRRTRHNSAKSDTQLQSLDETIDNVVKSSMSSSVSDAVSNKSTLDGDINCDTEMPKSNCGEISLTNKTGDLSSLEETMNEVIHKMSIGSPNTVIGVVQTPITCEAADTTKLINNNVKVSISSNDINKQKKMNVNHVKPPMYQLAGNMGGIANLVLGIPSILTVNTLVSQQNPLGPNKMTSQLTLPISKLAVSTIQSNIVSASSLVPSSITLHNPQTPVSGVQSTEVMLTKINSLTPIMIPAPMRNVPQIGQGNSLPSPSLIASRPLSNPVCGAIISGSNCNIPQDNTTSKLISVSLTASTNKPLTSSVNVIPRSPIMPNPALNLSKLSVNSVDAINYFLMQRQVSQAKSKMPNMCQQQSTSNDTIVSPNVTGLTASITNTGHSIILSQLTHANSVLSPITTAYLTAPINRTNPTTNLLQPLPSTNGMTTGITNPTTSVILRSMNIPFPKFEEKDDWLKQNQNPELSYPIRWTGKLCLKNDEVFVQMHMLAGNEDLIKNSMNMISNGQMLSQPLRIVQRMRLEPNQLEGLQRRLTRQLEFCTCLTLAGGDKSDELTRTSSILNDNFIKYLQEKSAAGIINICIPDSQQNAYVIHIFPPCEFSDNQLKICSSNLYDKLKKESVPYLLVVITTV